MTKDSLTNQTEGHNTPSGVGDGRQSDRRRSDIQSVWGAAIGTPWHLPLETSRMPLFPPPEAIWPDTRSHPEKRLPRFLRGVQIPLLHDNASRQRNEIGRKNDHVSPLLSVDVHNVAIQRLLKNVMISSFRRRSLQRVIFSTPAFRQKKLMKSPRFYTSETGCLYHSQAAVSRAPWKKAIYNTFSILRG